MNASISPPELVPPAYRTGPEYAWTIGDEVADLSAEVAGYAPDPEQRICLDMLFGKRADGKSAAFEFAAICARQNLKTGFIKQAALGWLFLTDEELVVWSAHEFATTKEAFRDMLALIEGSNWLSRRVLKTYDSSADTSIHMKSGARIAFKARTKTGGRGLSGRKTILDEGFALRGAHMGSLIPAMSAMPDPQVIYASSAGMADSTVLRSIRDRGRKGRGRLAYVEWCAPAGGCATDACEHELTAVGCALDRVENLRRANPLLGRTRANGTGMTLEYLQAERDSLPPAEFARERLGWWDDPGAAEVFGPGRWEACASETPAGCRLAAVALTVSVDLATAAVVGVGWVGARMYAQVIAHGPGFDWVPDEIPDGVRVLVEPKGPASVLVPALKPWRRRLTELRPADVFDAFDSMLVAVKEGDFLHDGDPVLTNSAHGATPKDTGDRRQWARRSSTSDITAIEGATYGVWWLARPAAPAPPPAPPPRTAPAPAARSDLLTVGF